MKAPAILLAVLLAAVAAARSDDAQPAPKVQTFPAGKGIQWLLVPRVIFQDANFEGAIEYLRRKAETHSGGALKLKFVVNLPDDFRPRHELSLDLNQIPFTAALNYLGDLAGVQFSIQGTNVIVDPLPASAGPRMLPVTWPSPPASPSPVKGLTGRLAEPTQPVFIGDNIYRNTGGAVQVEKSGYVRHRSMGGWPIEIDPGNKIKTDAVKPR